MSIGEFITLEGIEGAGKSSAVACVVETMQSLGRTVVATREPGGTELGERIRTLVLDKGSSSMCADTELLLMFAARAQHLEEVIRPALVSSKCVVCDRFTDATYAYQGGGRGLQNAAISEAEALVHADLQPHTTLLLDAAPDIGLERARGRHAADRFESEDIPFFTRVAAAYLARAAEFPERIVTIDANRNLDQVHAQIRAVLEDRYS